MQDVFVGRQPIYDRSLNVVAYELLFRSGQDNSARFADGDLATGTLLCNSLVEIGLEKLVGDRQAYVNLTRSFLTGKHQLPFEQSRIVLEILETIQVDDEVLASLRKLRDQGYTLALDDFLLDENTRRLVEVAHIVKLDVRATDRRTLDEYVSILGKFPVKLLAEKVETLDEYECCKNLGFELFQGYFLSRPRVIQAQRMPSNRLAAMQLLTQLQDPQAGFQELEKIISQDVSLSFKLLQYINSAAVGLQKKVDSLRQALTLLGKQRLQALASLIVLSGIDDQAQAVMGTAMVRARMCELLSQEVGRKDGEMFFTVGLFSALDALMNTKLDELLQRLPLSDDVKGALLCYEGAAGEALRCTLAYEQADWDNVRFLNVGRLQITAAYLAAIDWAQESQSTQSVPQSKSA